MKKVTHGQTSKILMLEDEVLFNQGDDGDKAYMVVSGRLSVEVDKNEAGYMSDGEVFGELALLLNQKRSATIIARDACELIIINKDKFNELINSASTEAKDIILSLCENLSKRNIVDTLISKPELDTILKDQNPTICAVARQIFFRLEKSTSHIE